MNRLIIKRLIEPILIIFLLGFGIYFYYYLETSVAGGSGTITATYWEVATGLVFLLMIINNQKLRVLIKQRTDEMEKYKLAVENASDHVIITDPQGMVVYANKGVERITGYKLEEVINQKAGSKNLWGGVMPLDFYKELWKTIKVEKKNFTGELKNKRKNGEEYIAMANITPVLDEKDNVKYFVGIERDITKEKEVDKMKTEFVSFASHQLRTPLSAMRWFAEMLLDGDAGKLSSEQEEMVRNIYESNKRMIELVGDLLDISRIESGRIIIDPQPTDLVELVKGVLKEVEIKAIKKHQKIITSLNSNMPLVNVDANLVRNVYLNLLTNAIKYTPEKGEVTVLVSKKGNDVISQVSDNGYGIPEEQQSSVFNKFFRANNAIKIETEGSGLGLYLVKAIIDSSGGKIWFESDEKRGTAFWFSLPIKGIKAKKGEVVLGS